MTKLTVAQMEEVLVSNNFFAGGLTDEAVEYHYNKLVSSVATQEVVKELAHIYFSKFNDGVISLNCFQQELLNLVFAANDNKIENWEASIEIFVPMICEQFNSYRANKDKNGYLLSINSSGSLLRQFEPYEE